MNFSLQARRLLRAVIDSAGEGSLLWLSAWSDESLDVFSSMLQGKEPSAEMWAAIKEQGELIHLLYFKELHRLADIPAVSRWSLQSCEQILRLLPAALRGSEEYRRSGRVTYLPEVQPRPVEAGARVLIDVSNTLTTQARTGIQRVVRELCRCFIDYSNYQLMAYDRSAGGFVTVSIEDGELALASAADPIVFHRQDVYFDLDASWGDPVSRWPLYECLRRGGVRIVHVHYDAVPVLFPALSHPVTVMRYIEHFFAMMVFSDRVFCISHAVRDGLSVLAATLGGRRPPREVMPLGSVLNKPAATGVDADVEPELQEFCAQGNYVLCVGTVEPRKNYQLLLDRLEEIKRLGLNVVIVGKRGWESEALLAMLEPFRQPGAAGNVLWLDKAGDDALHYLYQHCFVYLTVALYEGYGLPVIEALSYGCAVVTSDGGALAEVGRGHTRSFRLAEPQGLLDILGELVADRQAHADLKASAASFQEARWEDAAEVVRAGLGRFLTPLEPWSGPLQRVYISISCEKMRASLRSFVAFSQPKSVLVLTGEGYADEMRGVLSEFGVPGVVLCDEQLLRGLPLPDDHVARNFLLRKHLYAEDCVDPVFVASDDDSVQLRALSDDFYVSGQRYVARYFHSSMAAWKASSFAVSSYDIGQWVAAEVLGAHGYDDLAYSSHQPQIIDKNVAREIFEEYEDMVDVGAFDEWSLYFNVAMSRYSNRFVMAPTTTLRWPSDYSSWMPEWFIDEVYFENYYPENYLPKNVGEATAIAFDDDYRIKLHAFASEYDKYYSQGMLADVSGLTSTLAMAGDAGPLALSGNAVIGMAGCWVKVPTVGGRGRLGYLLNRQGVAVVDGRRDVQDVGPRADLGIRLPAESGKYELTITDEDGTALLSGIDLFVMPWRGINRC